MKKVPELTLLGLSKKEKQVFVCIEKGHSTPLLIHEATGISRTAIYHIVEILKKRGLVKGYIKEGKRLLRVATERELGDILYETKRELLHFSSGKEEIVVSDSTVIVHRGHEAVKECLVYMFQTYKKERFIGIQGKNDIQAWTETFTVKFINSLNRLIKEHGQISEGLVPTGWLEHCYLTFGPEWVDDYMGRAGRMHYLDEKYFNHSADIYIFKKVMFLISVKDLLVVEIRHSDISTAVLDLIRFAMDTTRPINYAEIIRTMVKKHEGKEV